MQKQHENWVRKRYNKKERTAPQIEADHLKHVHAGMGIKTKKSMPRETMMVKSKLSALKGLYMDIVRQSNESYGVFKRFANKSQMIV